MDFRSFAQTPPMGWNSWDCFGAGIDEKRLLDNARFMADKLKNYGWEYIVCDIQWYEPKAAGHDYKNFTELEMDEFSRLIPAPNRFPSSAGGKGFRPIADKIHAMGLKFGIHIMRGIPRQAVYRSTPTITEGVSARDIAQSYSICPWNTDMYGIDYTKHGAQEYYNSLFDLYASWGVDFVKCDDISNTEFKPHEPYSAAKEIEMIRKAIDNCGRKIVLSLSPGPAPIESAEHLKQNANMWRMTGDFWDEWSKLKAMFERCEKWQPYVGDGCWPDCDMLPIGNLCLDDLVHGRQTHFTQAEQITMMTLWTIFRSPLMIGCNLPDCDEFTLSLLTNPDLIEMLNSNLYSRQLCRTESDAVWVADSNDYRYIALFNLSDNESEIEAAFPADEVTEIWTKEKLPLTDNRVRMRIEAHGARLFRTAAK